jgi:hypothetical protein
MEIEHGRLNRVNGNAVNKFFGGTKRNKAEQLKWPKVLVETMEMARDLGAMCGCSWDWESGRTTVREIFFIVS